MDIVVTGAAGFIGFHLAGALLARGHRVLGIDNLNSYYDPALKRARLAKLENAKTFRFAEADVSAPGAIAAIGGAKEVEVFVHLAAQAGVRHALKEPRSYTRSNLAGQFEVLETARAMPKLRHLVYASSSSVYGNDTPAPFREDAPAGHPVSYYGATKRAGELMVHAYAELYGLRATGLRFFTVYGPYGRPDMAYWLFTRAILGGDPIPLFGEGRLKRDFTWIGDVTEALVRIVETPFRGEDGKAPHRLYNLGNHRPEEVRTLISLIEGATGRLARIEKAEAPPGDVRETYADIARAGRDFGFQPRTTLEEGIPRFVAWFREYHKL